MLNADLVLVGDIGGTNTRLQLYEVAKIDRITDGAKAPGKLLFEQQYLNGDFSSFDAVVAAFMKAAKVTAAPASACFAVAGPVESNRVNFTNRDWVIDGAKLEASLGIAKVRLINDFVANGYGLLTLDEGECVTACRRPASRSWPERLLPPRMGGRELELLARADRPSTETTSPFASEGGQQEVPRTRRSRAARFRVTFHERGATFAAAWPCRRRGRPSRARSRRRVPSPSRWGAS